MHPALAAPARLGNCSDNCSCVVLTSSVPAGRLRCSRLLLLAQLYLPLLTTMDGGNAKRLSGTILALESYLPTSL